MAKNAIGSSKIRAILVDLVSSIPETSQEAAADPLVRAREISRMASAKAAGLSFGMTSVPGPAGFLTILPDLMGVWALQKQMVADIAAAYGKSHSLDNRAMIYCLFRQAAAAAVADVVVRVGGRFLMQRASKRMIQGVLAQVGVRLSQQAVGKGISRLVPLLGPVAMGAYAAWDTQRVAGTAIELFSAKIEEGSGRVRRGAFNSRK